MAGRIGRQEVKLRLSLRRQASHLSLLHISLGQDETPRVRIAVMLWKCTNFLSALARVGTTFRLPSLGKARQAVCVSALTGSGSTARGCAIACRRLHRLVSEAKPSPSLILRLLQQMIRTGCMLRKERWTRSVTILDLARHSDPTNSSSRCQGLNGYSQGFRTLDDAASSGWPRSDDRVASPTCSTSVAIRLMND